MNKLKYKEVILDEDKSRGRTPGAYTENIFSPNMNALNKDL